MAEHRAILSTFPDADVAARVARALVEEQLVACVNLLPAIRSIYQWQGAIEESAEVLAILKTTAELTARAIARLTELHPYDVPEAIALDITAGHPPYLAWLTSSTTPAT